MQSYLLSAVGVIFLSVIASLLMPEGKLQKTIAFVMRLICILVLIRPVTQIFKLPSGESGESFADYGYVAAEYSRHQSLQLEDLISNEFSVDSECAVEVTYENGEFSVISAEVALKCEDENIIDEIKSYLRELGYINISVYAKST